MKRTLPLAVLFFVSFTAARAGYSLKASKPLIYQQPVAAIVEQGQLAEFGVLGAGYPAASFQWRKNDLPIPGATSATLLIPNAGVLDMGSYDVVVSNSVGTVVSISVPLTVVPPQATILRQPETLAVRAGQPASFTVVATSSQALSYQWKKEGAAIDGATGPTLTLESATADDVGSYTVEVTDSVRTIASSAAALTIWAESGQSSRLSAISLLGWVAPDTGPMIAGIVVSGSGETPVLIRGLGPALAQQHVSNFTPDPSLVLFDGSGAPIISNDNWGGSPEIARAAAAAGLSPLAPDSRDSTLLATFLPGAYSAQVSAAAGSNGLALMEVYDAGPGANSTRITALSARFSFLAGPGDQSAVLGFVVSGSGNRNLIIRGLGPSLGGAGVPYIAEPRLTLYSADGKPMRANDNWGGSHSMETVFAAAGLAPLPVDSKDAALLVSLSPGVYTVQFTAAAAIPGAVGIIEIYEAP